ANSTFSGNGAAGGGGISTPFGKSPVDINLTITNSTFSREQGGRWRPVVIFFMVTLPLFGVGFLLYVVAGGARSPRMAGSGYASLRRFYGCSPAVNLITAAPPLKDKQFPRLLSPPTEYFSLSMDTVENPGYLKSPRTCIARGFK